MDDILLLHSKLAMNAADVILTTAEAATTTAAINITTAAIDVVNKKLYPQRTLVVYAQSSI